MKYRQFKCGHRLQNDISFQNQKEKKRNWLTNIFNLKNYYLKKLRRGQILLDFLHGQKQNKQQTHRCSTTTVGVIVKFKQSNVRRSDTGSLIEVRETKQTKLI